MTAIVNNDPVSQIHDLKPPESGSSFWITALKAAGIAALVLGGIALIVLTSGSVLPAILFGATAFNYAMGSSLMAIGMIVAGAIMWKGKSISNDAAKEVPESSSATLPASAKKADPMPDTISSDVEREVRESDRSSASSEADDPMPGTIERYKNQNCSPSSTSMTYDEYLTAYYFYDL